MSFLKRLFGGGPAPQTEVNLTWFARIREEASLEVVGEAYRQASVLEARPPGPGDLPPGLPPPPTGYYKAMLVPEPSNEYDRNAISVMLWAGGDWSAAGYLSRNDAAQYQPLFRHLVQANPTVGSGIACDAALVPERDGTGVVLHLGTPAECAVELAIEDREPTAHRWVGKSIVFTGQGVTGIHGVPLDRFAQLMIARWAKCQVMPRLTRKADLLVVANPDYPTANLEKAREYGVATIGETEFVNEVGISAAVATPLIARWATR